MLKMRLTSSHPSGSPAAVALLLDRWRGRGPIAVVAALLVLLLVGMAVEPTRKLIEQRARLDEMTDDLGSMRAANARLEARIDRLRDPDFMEQRARAEAGLVRPGEIPYVVIPAGRRDRAPRRPSRPVSDRPGAIEGFLRFLGLG